MRLKFSLPIIAVAVTVGASAFTATATFAGDHHAHRHHTRMHQQPRDYSGNRHYSGTRDYSGNRDYSGYLDPQSGHYDPEFQRNRENFGFSGRDPSRVGGEDPSLHPPGMGR
jgi:hypothetical protein